MSQIHTDAPVNVQVGVTREVLDEVIEAAKTDLRRDIKTWGAIFVLGGNAAAALISSYIQPQRSQDIGRTALAAARFLVGL